MKKILLVIDSLGSGGAQNQLTMLASKLKESGYDIGVFTYYHNDFFLQRLTDFEINYYCAHKSDKIGFNVLTKLYRVVVNSRYETLISFMDTPNFYAAIIKRVLRAKIKLVISYRSMTDFNNISIFKRLTLEWTNSKADIIVANSHHERERWQQYQPKQAYKWITIYNGIEDKGFLLNRTRRAKLICVGSFSHFKNGLCVAEAMYYLKCKGELHFTLHWLGRRDSGIKGSEEYASIVDNYLNTHGLASNWVWDGQKTNVFEEYKNTDALIHASVVEGLPNVVCEAQMTGCPVIVSDVLDHSKLVQPLKNGLLFNPYEPKDLGDKILFFYNQDKGNFDKLCLNSREYAKNEYLLDKMVKKYTDLV